MRRALAALSVPVLLLCWTAARACEPAAPERHDLPLRGVVADVVDGDTVILKDGTEIRLAGIQAPKLPLGRRNFETWPLAPEAKAALAALVADRRVRLAPATAPRDRYGRALAQLFVHTPAGEIWVQGEMLARGLARAYTFADNRACAAALYAQEAKARQARLGIWALPYYAVRDAAHVPNGDIGRFVLVEGRVLDVARTGQRTYLNFGQDWKSDFTVTIDAKARKLFDAGVLDSLEGRNVRVRGWLERLNGPMIAVSHPEAIELLP